jgi:hypothetical protein
MRIEDPPQIERIASRDRPVVSAWATASGRSWAARRISASRNIGFRPLSDVPFYKINHARITNIS